MTLLSSLVENVYQKNFNLKPNERVLVVYDESKRNIATLFYKQARRLTKNVSLLAIKGMTRNGEEPSDALASAMAAHDVVVLVSTFSLTHTQAREKASAAGARIASLPGITLEMMARTLDVDYQAMAALSEKFATALTRGSVVCVTSPAGTDISFAIAGREGIADTGDFTKEGSFGNLPAGEAFIAPCEGTAEGVIVFDGALADIALDKPIVIDVSAGTIKSIRGGAAADVFKKQLASLPATASCVCEFGIGTNPKAKLSPNVLEAEKVYGTCHIAFGRNTTFGGTIDVSYHVDGIITKPTIAIDDTAILL